MIAGFPYDIYEETMIELFKFLKQGKFSNIYKDFYKDYKDFQRKIWSNNYYSVHKDSLQKRHLKEFIRLNIE